MYDLQCKNHCSNKYHAQVLYVDAQFMYLLKTSFPCVWLNAFYNSEYQNLLDNRGCVTLLKINQINDCKFYPYNVTES